MKRITKILSFLMVMSFVLSCFAVGAFAANSNVIFENEAEKFIFLPGSEYTDTDLFDNFKQMMPGDSRTQTVVVSNNYRGFDRIKVYLRALPHDSETNPLSDAVAKTETIASMEDFLSQLSMVVRADGNVIFSASPNELDGLKNNVFIGEIAYGETVKLDVELTMPIGLGNEYANRIGEVDWVFTVEQVSNPIIVPPMTYVTVNAVKMLDGKVPDTNEFQFQLTDSNGKVLQTVNNKGSDVIFNSITYWNPGIYTYYLSEIPGSRGDLNYDPSVYTVTVYVHNTFGFLMAEVSYAKDGVKYTGTPLFSNTTKTVIPDEPDEPTDFEPISVSVWAKKTLNQHLAIDSDFTFYLHDEAGNLLQTKTNVGGYIFFKRIEFDKAGTYVYYISEQKGSVDGMIYDNSVYKVTVKVVENSDELEAEVTYEKNGLEYNDTPLFANRTEVDPEIPPTSDSKTWMFGVLAGIVLIAAATTFFTTKKTKK